MRGDTSVVGKLLTVLGVALMLAGCAHVYPCNPAAPGVDLDQVNRALTGRRARVELVDGTQVFAHDVSISADSLFVGSKTTVHHIGSLRQGSVGRSIPLSSAKTIAVRRTTPLRGGFGGAIASFTVAAMAGSVVGAATYEPDEESWADSSYESAVKGGALFGALVAPLGFVFGAYADLVDVYDLTTAPSLESSG